MRLYFGPRLYLLLFQPLLLLDLIGGGPTPPASGTTSMARRGPPRGGAATPSRNHTFGCARAFYRATATSLELIPGRGGRGQEEGVAGAADGAGVCAGCWPLVTLSSGSNWWCGVGAHYVWGCGRPYALPILSMGGGGAAFFNDRGSLIKVRDFGEATGDARWFGASRGPADRWPTRAGRFERNMCARRGQASHSALANHL